MECERLQSCPFYNDKMDIESGLGKMYKRRYCMGDKTQCARYMVLTTLGPDFVPVELYPNMLEQAQQIIAQNSR